MTVRASWSPEEIVRAAERAEGPVIRRFCLFSGGNDSIVVAHRCLALYDELAFIDTGTALPGVREFVVEVADQLGKSLRILDAVDAYDDVVLNLLQGFPGPAAHATCYQRLKERQIRRLVKDARAEFGTRRQKERVMFLSGVRMDESARRKMTAAPRDGFQRERNHLWVNPLYGWTGDMMRSYREVHDLPQSDVAALMHRSGECNCGAFAAPGEREELRSLFPTWWEQRIAPLERELRARGSRGPTWGQRPAKIAAVPEAGPMCSDCQLRLEIA